MAKSPKTVFARNDLFSQSDLDILKDLRTYGDISHDSRGLLQVLVDSIPPLDSTAYITAYQKTLASLLGSNLPAEKIEPDPSPYSLSGYPYPLYASYDGPYKNYREAFFPNDPSAAAVEAGKRISGIDMSYACLAGLTQLISQKISLLVDSTKTFNEMSSFHSAMRRQCAHLYMASFLYQFQPSSTALKAFPDKKAGAEDLYKVIMDDQFTSNANFVLSGLNARQATWFLFNLWVSLDVLGYPDVDKAIRDFMDNGLQVPPQIQPTAWKNGTYTPWYNDFPISFLDSSIVTASFPEYFFRVSLRSYIMNGYSVSLCVWGKTAVFPPPKQSCFGEGTNVLMSDLSTKKIEDVRKGDTVYTLGGPREVEIVESPLLGNRPLYAVHKPDILATAGHCFRSGHNSGAKHLSIDQITTMTSAPTMILDGGIGQLSVGSVVEGLMSNGNYVETTKVTIAIIEESKQEPSAKVRKRRQGDARMDESKRSPAKGRKRQEDDTRVYDLILKEWWKDKPEYYVGGPDIFLATEAETSDPKADPATTSAILEMMEPAVEACKNYDGPVEEVLVPMIGQINLRELINVARNSKLILHEMKKRRLPRVKTFENDDGSWSENVSRLEYELVGLFGRWFRGCAHSQFAISSSIEYEHDFLSVRVQDIELVDTFALKRQDKVEVIMTLVMEHSSILRALEVDLPAEDEIFFIEVNKQVSFVRADEVMTGTACLYGEIRVNEESHATFSKPILLETMQGRLIDGYLTGGDYGKFAGRIGISHRRQNSYNHFGDVPDEEKIWGKDEDVLEKYSVLIGKTVGAWLGAALTSHGMYDRRV